jgi:hypothetical protein
VWNVWNSTLRELDAWHMGLIASEELKSINTTCDLWAGMWFRKYRYYKEIGEEIDWRLGKNDGLGEKDIVDRLNVVRLSIKHSPSIPGLTDGIRKYRGFVPFRKRIVAIDISSGPKYLADCQSTSKRRRLNPSHEVRGSSPQRSNRSRTGPYGGEDPSSNLITIPYLGWGPSAITVNEAWNIWNSTLRELDAWHLGLIAAKDRLKIQIFYRG